MADPVVRLKRIPASFVDKQTRTEQTRRRQFIRNSTKRIARGSENEPTYQRQHVIESLRRMNAAKLMDHSRMVTPEGGYWLMDFAAKTHTPDCIAMSGKNWPWEVLATVNPASLHSGCRCRIIPALTGARWGRKIPKAVMHELAEADIVELNGQRGVWRTLPGGVKIFILVDGTVGAGPKKMIGKRFSAPIREKPSMEREGYRPATQKQRERLGIPPMYTDAIITTEKGREPIWMALDGVNRVQPGYSEAHTNAQRNQKYIRIRELMKIGAEVSDRLWDIVDQRDEDSDAALAVIFMMLTGMRIGTPRQLGRVPVVGVSTLTVGNIKVRGDKITISAVTKGGKDFSRTLVAPELAKGLRASMSGKKPKDPLFDANDRRIRRVIKQAAGDFKAHDLRTHYATRTALDMARKMPVPKTDAQKTKQINTIAKHVSEMLGNNPGEALKSYIDPSVFDHFGEAA